MNNNLLEELLHEEESSTLDFKRDQYPFSGATDDQKSELLKDILAFANAWRRTTAYILIGIDEVKGGRSLLHGVAQHLNDNDLQQFVNSKTNRPVSFAYRAYTFEGVQLGIIEVPGQARPVFLRRPYGKLSASTVYVRRGSSTDIAQPDEIANMGAADAIWSEGQPAFELEWADISRQAALGLSVQVSSLVLAPQLSPRELMPRADRFGISFRMPGLDEPGEGYYRGLIDYAHDSQLLTPLGFYLRNTSPVTADGVVLKSKIERMEGVRLHDWRGKPIKPTAFPYSGVLSATRSLADQVRSSPEPALDEFPTHWELTVPFGKVLPRATVWSSNVVYVGADHPTGLTLRVELYAENLPAPQAVELNIVIAAEVRRMTRNDISLDGAE